MRKFTLHSILATALILVLTFSVSAQTDTKFATTDGRDLNKLLDEAKAVYDFDKEDAVLLLDRLEQHWMADGRLKTYLHQVLWINRTESAIDHFGDRRVPWDKENTDLEINHVRAWRMPANPTAYDNVWWDMDDGSNVETLPAAVRNAVDYTNMRETMMLHNGIEIPCILEVEYSFTDKKPFRAGAHGLWTVVREEPALYSEFVLSHPKKMRPSLYVSKDAPKVAVAEKGDIKTHSWIATNQPALPMPRTDDPAGYVPHITWSTWKNWKQFGGHIAKLFEDNLTIGAELEKEVQKIQEKTPILLEQVDMVCKLVDGKTRYIDYNADWWWDAPRTAQRVYETAFGHRIDRAILAAGLFKALGFEIWPAFRSLSFGDVDEKVPALDRFEGVYLWVIKEDGAGGGVNGYYDPETSELSNGFDAVLGRTIWAAGDKNKPSYKTAGEGTLDVRLSLKAKKEGWCGKGFIANSNGLSSFGAMQGLDGNSTKYLNKVLDGILGGGNVKSFNPVTFDRFHLQAGFKFDADFAEKDKLDRIPVKVGGLTGGIWANLPWDVELFNSERTAPIRAFGPMKQSLTVELDADGYEFEYVPADVTIENAAGKFTVTSKVDEHKVTFTRTLELKKATYEPGEWKDLRALLLGEFQEKNRTILMTTCGCGGACASH